MGYYENVWAILFHHRPHVGFVVRNRITNHKLNHEFCKIRSICEDVHDPDDGQQAIIEDEDLVNGAMSRGKQTDSSNDYEIMITPRLWKKLLAARKKRRGFRKRRGRNSRRGKREDGDDDDEIMFTPRLWKKLQAAQKKRGKGGKD